MRVTSAIDIAAPQKSLILPTQKLIQPVIQGDDIVLAAEPLAICGIDVAAFQTSYYSETLTYSGIQGDYVVLAAEPLAICGIDVAAPQELRSKRRIATRDLFTSFAGQFTPAEVGVIECISGHKYVIVIVQSRSSKLAFETGETLQPISTP